MRTCSSPLVLTSSRTGAATLCGVRRPSGKTVMQADLHAKGRQPVVPQLDVKANMPYSRPPAADNVCVPVIELGHHHDEALPPRHTEDEQECIGQTLLKSIRGMQEDVQPPPVRRTRRQAWSRRTWTRQGRGGRGARAAARAAQAGTTPPVMNMMWHPRAGEGAEHRRGEGAKEGENVCVVVSMRTFRV